MLKTPGYFTLIGDKDLPANTNILYTPLDTTYICILYEVCEAHCCLGIEIRTQLLKKVVWLLNANL